jgi:hypothetical protein
MKAHQISKFLKISLLLLILALSVSSAMGLGVGPSRQYISYLSGQKIQDKLIIINDGKEDFKAGVYAQGDLASYVKIIQPLLEVSSTDSTKAVSYEINFPNTPPTPGEHRIDIVVRQFPAGNNADEGTTVSANMAVIAQIVVKVPYPGKFAEGKLFISGSEKNDTPTSFVIQMYNYGTEPITDAHAKVEIFGPNLEKVDELETESKAIKPKEEAQLQAVWQPKVSKGTYKALVTVVYDDKEFKIEQNFDVGIFVIDVSDISVKKFKLGDVAKFDILLFNSWNRDMQDVYVEMTVEDKTGKKMTEFKTGAIDIPSQQTGSLEAYWYTEGVMPGIYNVKLVVHYAGKITQKEYEFEVNTNSVTRIGTSAIGQAVGAAGEKGASSQKVIIALILIVLVLLIAMNIAWFYIISKKLKGEGK